MNAMDPRPRLSALLREELAGRDVRVLEAGCGAYDHLDPPESWRVTGLDISPEALALNERLDERIEGDLQLVRHEPRFDLIVCWDVLEHLPDPGAALANMAGGLRPGGLLVIAVPLRSSFKGWATRLLPFWFHVAYYRHVMRWEHAGEPGHRPFVTHHKPAIEPAAMGATLGHLGLEEVWVESYATEHYREIMHGYGPVSWFTRFSAWIVGLASFGRVRRLESDYIGVYRRLPEASREENRS